jgi:hypothetical protein
MRNSSVTADGLLRPIHRRWHVSHSSDCVQVCNPRTHNFCGRCGRRSVEGWIAAVVVLGTVVAVNFRDRPGAVLAFWEVII